MITRVTKRNLTVIPHNPNAETFVFILISGRTKEVIGVYDCREAAAIDMRKWSAGTGDHECFLERWLVKLVSTLENS